MASFIASVVDAANEIVNKLTGRKLCAYCNQWAKKPHRSGHLYFCDKIHASIHFNKQQELMKEAIRKREEEKRRS